MNKQTIKKSIFIFLIIAFLSSCSSDSAGHATYNPIRESNYKKVYILDKNIPENELAFIKVDRSHSDYVPDLIAVDGKSIVSSIQKIFAMGVKNIKLKGGEHSFTISMAGKQALIPTTYLKAQHKYIIEHSINRVSSNSSKVDFSIRDIDTNEIVYGASKTKKFFKNPNK